jgi:aminopeptidase N
MQAAEITRDETGERARLLRVCEYDVTLDLTRGAELFRSTTVISFDCTEPGAASHADLIAHEVHEISLNGTRIDPASACAEGRIALADLAGHNELRVVADCRYSADGTGLHRSVDPADGKVYSYTKFEPAYARTVYANFEQPDLKAPFTIHVLAPARWIVLSNQPGSAHADGDHATWHFRPTPALPTYLFAVVAGEYTVVRDSHTTPAGQVIPLGLACRASLAPYLDADEILGLTRQGLDYYTGLFQGDFPFAKYDQVFVPEFSAGATESAACVIFTDRLLFSSRVTDTMRELRASVILHEMAHMWFGDLVTMTWWDDLWLNESFAEFCATLSSAEATRFTAAWATFCGSRKAWGYQQDQLPSTHPVAADVPTLSQAIANFDGISYAKGASVLRQLVARVGRDSFLTGIRAYFGGHAWGNARLADLLHALEASSGTSLTAWSDAWLKTTGPNTLQAVFELDRDGAFRSFEVKQAAAGQQPVLRPHRIAVGLYSLTGGGLARTRQVEVDIDGELTAVRQLVGVPQPDLLLLNDDDLTYALLRFDHRSIGTLTSSIGQLVDPLARAVCWTSVLDMVSQAELAVPSLVRMVAGGMAGEPSVAALQIVLSMTEAALLQLADPQGVAAGRQQLADAAGALLAAAGPGSDYQLAWAQLLCWTAASPDQLDRLAGLLSGRESVPGLAVDADLRWAMLGRLAAAGRVGLAGIDAELATDTTDAGARHAAACRAAMPDAAQKAAAWRLLTETDLPVDMVQEIAGGFYQPEQADLLAPYAARYFDVMPKLWAARGGHLRVRLGEALFPRTAAGPELLAQIDAFLAADRDPGLVRVLIERRDLVGRALRSRALPDTSDAAGWPDAARRTGPPRAV